MLSATFWQFSKTSLKALPWGILRIIGHVFGEGVQEGYAGSKELPHIWRYPCPDDSRHDEQDEADDDDNADKNRAADEFPKGVRRPQVAECRRLGIIMRPENEAYRTHFCQHLNDGKDDSYADEERDRSGRKIGGGIRLEASAARENTNDKENADKKIGR